MTAGENKWPLTSHEGVDVSDVPGDEWVTGESSVESSVFHFPVALDTFFRIFGKAMGEFAS